MHNHIPMTMAAYHPYSNPDFLMDGSDPSVSPTGSDQTQQANPSDLGGGVGKWIGGSKAAPVKAACLSCRTKKAKCDGKQPVCGQCARKNLECVFVKSRRGGARKRRPAIAPTALAEFLKKLDSLLMAPSLDHGPSTDASDSEIDPNEDTSEVVLQFATREEVFERYYTDVHPFVTVMPPRTFLQTILPTLLPSSPFLLAVQTILVLVPHPKDPNSKSSRSKRMRQAASQSFADQAMRLVDQMSESGNLNIECVQAVSIVALWEWSSLGSVSKNRARAQQAVRLAMQLGLHEMDRYSQTPLDVNVNENGRTIEGVDWQRDMARRTWWTTYVCQLTAALVTGQQPIVGPDDPGVFVNYPICQVMDRSWENFIETVKQTLRVANLVTSVYFPDLANNGGAESGLFSANHATHTTDSAGVREKMYDMDKKIMDLIKQAEKTAVVDLVPGGEEEVTRNQQLQARLGLAVVHIHIHRWQAFPEVSLFSKKICGLPQAPDFVDSPATQEGYIDTPPTLGNQGNHQPLTSPGRLVSGISQQDPHMPYSAPAVNYMTHQGYDQMLYTNGQGLNSDSNGDYSHGHDINQYVENALQPSDWTSYENSSGADGVYNYGMVDDMWAPETYPESLPAPWFSYPGGAANLYAPVHQEPHHYPEMTASIVPIQTPPPLNQRSSVTPSDAESNSRRVSLGSSSIAGSNKPHKAWGVDDKSDKVLPPPDVQKLDVFPPGISLARCATAAHTIVRLEVLHRSAVIAMWDGPPKWPPFCSCGLVTGAYAFLLLALAVQAENTFSGYTNSRSEEVEALLTNVKVILAGLEAYGTMWAGIDTMAGEVRAALEAATRLPFEVSTQIENAGTASPSTQGGRD
ncbi:uncharacterized protein IL334_001991 [Kwoniella shivajii]|uniref:Zn(2)-C6 fungal-type domain-containing protein n=1 Tax=Kwoniella shivajii TaxID=564305 RepID=A0ABZ1CTG5_9TREE|nr:hypothetical protein IL334_001991 [Kwoniella shivajii]